MENQSEVARNKAVVDAYYQAGKEGRLTDFAPYLHPDFTTTAPDYLPWGGTHRGAGFFRDTVLPNLPDTLDFSRFSYDVFVGEGNQVVALINIGVAGTGWSRTVMPDRFGSPISSRNRCSTSLALSMASRRTDPTILSTLPNR